MFSDGAKQNKPTAHSFMDFVLWLLCFYCIANILFDNKTINTLSVEFVHKMYATFVSVLHLNKMSCSWKSWLIQQLALREINACTVKSTIHFYMATDI